MADLIFTDTAGTLRALWGEDVARINPLTNVHAAAQIPWTQASASARPTLIEYEISSGNTIAAIEKDGATEELEMVIPNGLTDGRVAYCSPDHGIWIEDGVTVAPGGTLDSGMAAGAGGTVGLIGALGRRFWAIIPLDGERSNDAAILNSRARALGLPGVLTAGPELLTNGDFATGDLTGWTDTSTGTGSATVNGSNQAVLSYTDVSNSGRIAQDASSGAGLYELNIDLSNSTRNLTVEVRPEGGGAVIESFGLASGAASTIAVHTYLSGLRFNLLGNSVGTGDTIIDSVSVKKLTAGA